MTLPDSEEWSKNRMSFDFCTAGAAVPHVLLAAEIILNDTGDLGPN
jgi:hypothetical protein